MPLPRGVMALLAIVAISTPVVARAQASLAEEVAIGRPARTLRVDLAPGSDRVRISVGTRAEEAPIEFVPTSASVARVALGGDAAVAVMRAASADEEAAFVFAVVRQRPRVLWRGSLSWSGDPGERWRDAIEIRDRTGDGVDDVVVGVEREAARICGQPHTLLETRAVDPQTLELRTVELRRLPQEEEIEIVATRQSPGPEGAPVLQAIAFTAASSTVGQATDAASRTPPLQLVDRDPATYWAEGRAGAGRWEFATARYIADVETRAVVITMPPSAAGLAPPSHIWLVGDAGARIRVAVPSDARAGERLWAVLPASRAWRCLAIVLDDARGDAAATAIADVEVYTELDFGDGIDALVASLVSDSEGGSRAADVLRRLGAVGVEATLEAWPTLTPTGKRRAIRVLAAHPGDANVRAALVEAARDADAEVGILAIETLVAAGESAQPVLAELALVASVAGDRAAVALAESAPRVAIAPLLAAVAADGGSERAALRAALRLAARRGGAPVREEIDRWARDSPDVASAAAVALALASVDETRAIAVRLATGALEAARRFEDRWRLIAAEAELETDDAGDAWLAGLASGADEWMLRAAALEALALRRSPRVVETARAALDDPYPRVRAMAVRALAEKREARNEVAALARRDRWPLVRAGAVEALAGDAESIAVVRAALDDDAKGVRAAALRALTARADRRSLGPVRARLEDADEWPEVLMEAIAYAQAVCAPELVEGLASVVRRGMRPDAWAPDIDVAVRAIDALAAIGGEDAEAVLRRAGGEVAPGPLRVAAARARALAQRCR